jgi:hypothetical protein
MLLLLVVASLLAAHRSIYVFFSARMLRCIGAVGMNRRRLSPVFASNTLALSFLFLLTRSIVMGCAKT